VTQSRRDHSVRQRRRVRWGRWIPAAVGPPRRPRPLGGATAEDGHAPRLTLSLQGDDLPGRPEVAVDEDGPDPSPYSRLKWHRSPVWVDPTAVVPAEQDIVELGQEPTGAGRAGSGRRPPGGRGPRGRSHRRIPAAAASVGRRPRAALAILTRCPYRKVRPARRLRGSPACVRRWLPVPRPRRRAIRGQSSTAPRPRSSQMPRGGTCTIGSR
jgi:hypothetical protein